MSAASIPPMDVAFPIILDNGIPNIMPAISAGRIDLEVLPEHLVVLEVTAKDSDQKSFYLHTDPRIVAEKMISLIERGATRRERCEAWLYTLAKPNGELEEATDCFFAVFPQNESFYFSTRFKTAFAKQLQLQDPEFDQTSWYAPTAPMRAYRRNVQVAP
jgi:hypothetical protein